MQAAPDHGAAQGNRGGRARDADVDPLCRAPLRHDRQLGPFSGAIRLCADDRNALPRSNRRVDRDSAAAVAIQSLQACRIAEACRIEARPIPSGRTSPVSASASAHGCPTNDGAALCLHFGRRARRTRALPATTRSIGSATSSCRRRRPTSRFADDFLAAAGSPISRSRRPRLERVPRKCISCHTTGVVHARARPALDGSGRDRRRKEMRETVTSPRLKISPR